ncbi:hypothetical protein CLF_103368 [Clonorchis sinensis]|uniref:Uncharacterized protein n=1 Tax=Clonorchis sinensis TaxID=79923 RepID=G7Y9M7_CLOSI|nr:hypothetical protein CLF_103368 [Clonorchis sinensis]
MKVANRKAIMRIQPIRRTWECMYKIKRNDCTKAYVDQTARELHTRIGERLFDRPPRNVDEYQAIADDSAMARHAMDARHRVDLENVGILRMRIRFIPQRPWKCLSTRTGHEDEQEGKPLDQIQYKSTNHSPVVHLRYSEAVVVVYFGSGTGLNHQAEEFPLDRMPLIVASVSSEVHIKEYPVNAVHPLHPLRHYYCCGYRRCECEVIKGVRVCGELFKVSPMSCGIQREWLPSLLCLIVSLKKHWMEL